MFLKYITGFDVQYFIPNSLIASFKQLQGSPHIVKTGRLDFSLSWLKGEVSENLGDFQKSIQILTFLFRGNPAGGIDPGGPGKPINHKCTLAWWNIIWSF
jgi:hypothetical protein